MNNMFRNPRHTNKLKHGQEGGRPLDEDDEDDNNNAEQFDDAVNTLIHHVGPMTYEDDEDDNDDEAYRQPPSREEQAVLNIREFINSPEITTIGTMNLEQQRHLIQEEMDRVVRDNIPVLRNSSDEGRRELARDFELTYGRLLEGIEERNKALYRAAESRGASRRKDPRLTQAKTKKKGRKTRKRIIRKRITRKRITRKRRKRKRKRKRKSRKAGLVI